MTTTQTHERPAAAGDDRRRRSARLKLLAVVAVCAAPVLASYFAYYLVRPEGRTNYGELLDPQPSVASLQGVALDAARFELSQLRGKWVMLTADSGACGQPCQDKLYAIRQVRLTTGKDRDRVERVLLLTDDTLPAAALLEAHEGMHVVRVEPQAAARALPAAAGAVLADHVFIVDPLGKLMMRFPKAADPNRMKKDVGKLLRASRVG